MKRHTFEHYYVLGRPEVRIGDRALCGHVCWSTDPPRHAEKCPRCLEQIETLHRIGSVAPVRAHSELVKGRGSVGGG